MIPFSSMQWGAPGAPKFQILSLPLVDNEINKKGFLPFGNLPFLEKTKTLANDSIWCFKGQRWTQVVMGAWRKKSIYISLGEFYHSCLTWQVRAGRLLKKRIGRTFQRRNSIRHRLCFTTWPKHIMEEDRFKTVFVNGAAHRAPYTSRDRMLWCDGQSAQDQGQWCIKHFSDPVSFTPAPLILPLFFPFCSCPSFPTDTSGSWRHTDPLTAWNNVCRNPVYS